MLYYASKTPLLNETQRQLERAGCGRDRTPVFPKMPIFINVVLIMFVLSRLFRCPMLARIQNPLAGLLLDGSFNLSVLLIFHSLRICKSASCECHLVCGLCVRKKTFNFNFVWNVIRSTLLTKSQFQHIAIKINLTLVFCMLLYVMFTGNKKLVKETVPLYSKLIIKCNFDSPAWYKNGKLIPVDHKRAKS